MSDLGVSDGWTLAHWILSVIVGHNAIGLGLLAFVIIWRALRRALPVIAWLLVAVLIIWRARRRDLPTIAQWLFGGGDHW
jgi:hypothetical protein